MTILTLLGTLGGALPLGCCYLHSARALRSMVVLPFILLTLKWDGATSFSWGRGLHSPFGPSEIHGFMDRGSLTCPLKAISKMHFLHLPLSSLLSMTIRKKIPQEELRWIEYDRMGNFFLVPPKDVDAVSNHMKGCYASLGCGSPRLPIESIEIVSGT